MKTTANPRPARSSQPQPTSRITVTPWIPHAARKIEFVERKGDGHPDSLCDHLAEALAGALTRHFVETTGRIRHFNVDKALLAAGEAKVGFGGGTVLRPTRIILAGKVDMRHGPLPFEALREAAYRRLFEILPEATREGYRIEVLLNPSSTDLLPLLELGAGADVVPLANDTSVGTAFAPRTPLEEAVYQVEQTLARASIDRRLPIGRDIKVMGVRRGQVVHLTLALPVLASSVTSVDGYREVLEHARARAYATAIAVLVRAVPDTKHFVKVFVNGADQHPDGAYLTLSGSSAEAGDDGQVGRGNRIGGLITPYRTTSLEAACGKNPAAHVGKLYQALAWDAATAIAAADLAQDVTVTLVSRIGTPVSEPVEIDINLGVHPSGERRLGVEQMKHAARLAQGAVEDWRAATRRLIEGHYPLV